MSQQKKQNDTISNQKLLNRLYRLDIVKNYPIEVVIAYIGLNLVNKGKAVDLARGLKIIQQSKLHKKIEANSVIPCVNILEAMIHLVVYKRKLFEKLFSDDKLEVWSDETIAPLLDIAFDISKEYLI